MAEHYTHFSCLLDLRDPAKAEHAMRLFAQLRAEDEEADEPQLCGFEVELQDDAGSAILWLHDDEHGDVENLVKFVLRLAEDLDLTGLWGFDYAETCSRPIIGSYGGGAHVIDLTSRKSMGWFNTRDWLSAALIGDDIGAIEALAS